MLKLFTYLRLKEWLFLLISLGLIVVQVWFDLRIPDYMAEITIYVQTEGNEMSDIVASGGKMIFCAFGSLIAAFLVSIMTSRIASNFSASIRKALFYRVQQFSLKEINSFSTASLITRSTNDITHIQMLFVMGIQVVFKTPIMVGIALSKISGKSREWSFTTGSAVVILLVIVGLSIFLTIKKFNRIQYLADDLNRITRENINGIQVLRAYNAENYRSNVFCKTNEELVNTNLYTNIVMSFMNPGISLVMSGLTLAIYWVGAGIINRAENMEKIKLFSDMVVYSSYATQIVSAFMMLVMVFIILPRAIVSGKRVAEVMDKKVSVLDGSFLANEKSEDASLKFKNVSFKYPDSENNVLSNINFTANKGETVAIIGSTGCGKTSLVNLIMRFYDVTEGEILVDGIDVKKYTQKSLRDKIGYVPQKAFLFSGSIRSNVAYSSYFEENIDQKRLSDAISSSYVHEFMDKMEHGVESKIAREGANISGGQKQRISIARAIYKNPEIFIFDDSFSALDYKTDKLVRNEIKEKYSDAIKIIVAQRIGTILDADKIIVIDEGKIVGMGNHDTLMQSCEVYQQIAATQLLGGAEKDGE